MHAALLLDDVLRQIFAHNTRRLNPAVASTCRAWLDPALDEIWCHVPSLAPLFSLIRGISCVDGVYNIVPGASIDLTAFNSYAFRIKHITQRHDIRLDPALLAIISQPGTPILQKLVTTQLCSTDPHSIPTALSLCPTLRQFDLRLDKQRNNDNALDYIAKLLDTSTSVERVRLGGLPDPRLNDVICRTTHLRSLTLRTGTFLAEDTLVAISSFPCLSELDFEGGHLDADLLSKAWTVEQSYFQALEKLHVRAQAPVIQLLLKMISPSLRTLHVEVTSPPGVDREPSVCWSTIFDLIKLNALHTETLTIEQHLDDIDLDSAGSGAHPSSPNLPNPNQLTFDIIRLLAPLRCLRSFTIDMTRIPNLCDRDIETLATWWPCLEHLDLGSLHSDECISPRTTLACLASLSSMRKLQSLIIPLGIDDTIPGPCSSSSSVLSRVTITSASPPSPALVASYLHGVFPLLKQVEGSDRHEAQWGEVNGLLSGMQ